VPIRIVVDEREKGSRIPNLLRQAGAIIDFAQLKVGDYIVSPETAIERKTIRDLISSIYDGRLFVQCSELAQHYSRPVVIIEGNIVDLLDFPTEIDDNDQLKILEERIPLAYDALAVIALEFRIPIIHTPCAEYTSQLLVVLVNKSLQEGRSSGPLLKRIKKSNPIYIQQLSILSSLPGIGDKLAVRMLEKFRTPQRALSASIAELARIPGFGTARAEKIRKILDYPYNDKIELTQKTLLEDIDHDKSTEKSSHM
jgi:DNA excision repair protein ERCC-4